MVKKVSGTRRGSETSDESAIEDVSKEKADGDAAVTAKERAGGDRAEESAERDHAEKTGEGEHVEKTGEGHKAEKTDEAKKPADTDRDKAKDKAKKSTGADGEMPPEEEYPYTGPPRFEGWRKRSATGAMLTGFAFGLREVFEAPREDPPIMMESSGEPPRDLPVDAEVGEIRPMDNVVKIRPWLLEGEDSGKPEGSSGNKHKSSGNKDQS